MLDKASDDKSTTIVVEAPPAAVSRRPLGISLRGVLGLAFVGLLVVVSAALVGLDYRRSRNAAIEDAKQEMRIFSARLADRFGLLFADTAALVRLAAVSDIFLAPPQQLTDAKTDVMRRAMAASPHIDGAYAGYPDGSFFHVVDLKDEGWRAALAAPPKATTAVRIVDPEENGEAMLSVTFLDAAGRKLPGGAPAPSGYDPRFRPWYVAASHKTAAIVTDPYEMATTRQLGMTIAEAHRSEGSIVVGADIVLGTITAFLSSERMTPGTVAFVINASGTPIIHSDPEIMAAAMSRSDDAGLTADPLVRAVARLGEPGAAGNFVDIGGRTFLVEVMPLETRILDGHRIAIAAPLDELLAGANRDLLQGLAISASVLALAILAALLLARRITNSLHLLTRSADRLHDLDFSAPIEVRSRVEEISTLGRAMGRAHDAIFTFALYVPKEFVRRVVEAGHTAGGSARRQEVTALFTDIYDFTTISERYPPEEVVTMLSSYFEIFSQTVSEHNGTIIQFLGDSVFAMWNAPIADADHAEHACLCALATETRLAVFNEAQRMRGLPEFRTRYGIHSGSAVVGSVGGKERLQYTAMGDTINVASRLEGMNKLHGTSILASGAVVERVAGKLAFRPLGEGQAKGRSEKLDLFEVLAPAAGTEAEFAPTPPGRGPR